MIDPLDQHRNRELTIEELLAAARKLLRHHRVEAEDGRVAETLELRTLRYYQTMGLLDKPQRFQGPSGHLRDSPPAAAALHPQAAGRRPALGPDSAGDNRAIRPVPRKGPPRSSVDTREPASVPPGTGGPRGLVAGQAAGVSVLIDPTVVSDPPAVLSRIAALLASPEENLE